MKAVTLFIVKETPRIRELFSEASRNQAALVRSGDGLAGYLKRKKIELLLGISRDSEPERASGAGPSIFLRAGPPHPGVLRAINYLEDHFCEKVSLHTLAKSAHLSEFRLWHLFKEETGKSPKAYLDTVRISRAREHLKRQEVSISKVGRSVGFSDPSRFSKTFLRVEGVSPSEYREKTNFIVPFGAPKKARSAKKKARNDKNKAGQRPIPWK